MKLTGTNGSGGAALSMLVDLTTSIGLDQFVDPPTPDAPGGTGPAVITRQPTDAIWQDGVLTFASTTVRNITACARVPSSTPGRRPGPSARIPIPPSTSTGAPDTWYPGIGQSQSGILDVVYTQSSVTEGMSSYDRYQLPSDAINTLSDPREIADGGGLDYGGTRWGNYVGVAQVLAT